MTDRKGGEMIGIDPPAVAQAEGAMQPDAPLDRDKPATAQAQVSSTAPGCKHVLTLEDSLTIQQAASLYRQLSDCLNERDVVLDVAVLTRVDTAGLQLLAAFVRTATSRGVHIEWRAPQAELRAAARHAGMENALQLS